MDSRRKSLFLTISAEVEEIGEVLEGKLTGKIFTQIQ